MPRSLEEEERWLVYRSRILPEQLDRARRRYLGLCREAKRLGLTNLLNDDELEK